MNEGTRAAQLTKELLDIIREQPTLLSMVGDVIAYEVMATRTGAGSSCATTGLDFGAALRWMRSGRKVRRAGWGGTMHYELAHLQDGEFFSTNGACLLATDWEVVEEGDEKGAARR